jgi:DNA helicase HerA-like ATPase
MTDPFVIAKGEQDYSILPRMMNRHGMVAGATGTGKTITLQGMVEHLSGAGVPVVLADVKGDLAGISQAGAMNPRIEERLKLLGVTDFPFQGYPVAFWDLFGELGHPIRATVSDMGPLLISRLLDLNDTQTGVMNAVFQIADDAGLLLLDLKDLRSMLGFVGENASQYTTEYGNISKATVGAIQRGLLELEGQGSAAFFGEPALDIFDLMKTGEGGKGVVNILAAQKLMQTPKAYATFLLWLLAELFERLPEVGDLEKPKLVFFFDEAHLLFDDVPKALLEKIEQVVRLIRSKGVGVFFISQSPIDIPESVAGQLGNRVQHALRAFTAKDQKAIKATADTFRSNPALDVAAVLIELGVGEALVSFLDEKGAPGVVQRAFIYPPRSKIGPIDDAARQQIMAQSAVSGKYEEAVDRESAYELLLKKSEEAAKAREAEEAAKEAEKQRAEEEKRRRRSKNDPEDILGNLANSAAKAIGSRAGREIVRGILGSIFGGRR